MVMNPSHGIESLKKSPKKQIQETDKDNFYLPSQEPCFFMVIYHGIESVKNGPFQKVGFFHGARTHRKITLQKNRDKLHGWYPIYHGILNTSA